ncbi:MAG TPA: hypothetical protein VK587_07440 [bacterium]|nr:hypothetical protein [bacterium]
MRGCAGRGSKNTRIDARSGRPVERSTSCTIDGASADSGARAWHVAARRGGARGLHHGRQLLSDRVGFVFQRIVNGPDRHARLH